MNHDKETQDLQEQAAPTTQLYSTYAEAALAACEINLKQPVRVVAELGEDGVIAVYASRAVELVILDHTSSSGDYITVDGFQVKHHRVDVEVDDESCEVVFREVENYEQMLDLAKPDSNEDKP